jgi:hypothetical protein
MVCAGGYLRHQSGGVKPPKTATDQRFGLLPSVAILHPDSPLFEVVVAGHCLHFVAQVVGEKAARQIAPSPPRGPFGLQHTPVGTDETREGSRGLVGPWNRDSKSWAGRIVYPRPLVIA